MDARGRSYQASFCVLLIKKFEDWLRGEGPRILADRLVELRLGRREILPLTWDDAWKSLADAIDATSVDVDVGFEEKISVRVKVKKEPKP